MAIEKHLKKDEQRKLINDIISNVAKGIIVENCRIICKRYNITERTYQRYKRVADKAIINWDEKEKANKRANAELFYLKRISQLESDYKKGIDLDKTLQPDEGNNYYSYPKTLTQYQKEQLILKARQQLDKIQGLVIDKIDHTTGGKPINEISEDDKEKIKTDLLDVIKKEIDGSVNKQ